MLFFFSVIGKRTVYFIHLFFVIFFVQLGPNVSIGTGVTIGAGVRVRESIILHGANLQVSVPTHRPCGAPTLTM